jgi:Holliday junction resolvase
MSQPESRLSRQIMEALRARGAFVFKVHGGPTMMNGLPDIIVCYRGWYIGLETKLPGGRTSAVQNLRHGQITEAGGVARVVHSVAEAVAVLAELDEAPEA